MRLLNGRYDVGLIWGKCLNTLSQVGALAGFANLLMVIGIFYTTTFHPATGMSLWMYLLIILIGGVAVVSFILTIGISGYYRFFNQQSAVNEINSKLDILLAEKKKESDDVDSRAVASKH